MAVQGAGYVGKRSDRIEDHRLVGRRGHIRDQFVGGSGVSANTHDGMETITET